jgi:hypothetical protein
VNRRFVIPTLALALTFVTASAAGARTIGRLPTAPPCKAVNFKPGVHRAATAREQTLKALADALRTHVNPDDLNGAQVGALQSANSSLAALDSHIASTCYSTFAAFRADAAKVWDDYRVYWLRVPQTHVIGATDHLEKVATRLEAVAQKLSKYARTDVQSQADYAALTSDLAQATKAVGSPPNAAAVITTAANLLPAKDMAADDAALQAAHAALAEARGALNAARADAYKMIADLKA